MFWLTTYAVKPVSLKQKYFGRNDENINALQSFCYFSRFSRERKTWMSFSIWYGSLKKGHITVQSGIIFLEYIYSTRVLPMSGTLCSIFAINHCRTEWAKCQNMNPHVFVLKWYVFWYLVMRNQSKKRGVFLLALSPFCSTIVLLFS